jgi:hypothetical protein
MNVNHKMTAIRYHLTHDDGKVTNRMTSNELKCLLFNDNHHALSEQKRFVMIMTSESCST